MHNINFQTNMVTDMSKNLIILLMHSELRQEFAAVFFGEGKTMNNYSINKLSIILNKY